MFKGAIDNLHPQRVGGWMYSPQGILRGMTVLAFVDDRCVGAGRIELFRQDLAEAGLGDGYLGFDFPIGLSDPSEVGRVVVKVDASDALILPPCGKVTSPSRASTFADVHYTLESIEWMRSRGWLGAMDVTFLRSIHQLGVFEYSLVKPKTQASPEGGVTDANSISTQFLQLIALGGPAVKCLTISISDGIGLINDVVSEIIKPIPVVAIHATLPGTIAVIEGSQNDAVLPVSFEDAISYPIGPNRLLFLNLLCGFHIDDELVGHSMSVYTA